MDEVVIINLQHDRTRRISRRIPATISRQTWIGKTIPGSVLPPGTLSTLSSEIRSNGVDQVVDGAGKGAGPDAAWEFAGVTRLNLL